MELTPEEIQIILYRRAVKNTDISLDTTKFYMTLDDNENGDKGGKGAGANEEYVGGDILKGGKLRGIVGSPSPASTLQLFCEDRADPGFTRIPWIPSDSLGFARIPWIRRIR